ncbi:MAG: hypothetical protein H6739_29010 [Alphaproteobacteria bacterium]|nr:hypothetical protein [Alphaproteobacteria bacterium]
MHRVLLIPGFFGFSTIGDMRYFAHVRRALGAALAREGLEATLHEVPTLPTASLQRRAARLAEVAVDLCDESDQLHLVGHSTGGLDARLLLAPGADVLLPPGWAALQPRVRTVVSVASPHQGAPIARFFSTVQGERWLRLISILTLHVVRLGDVAVGPTSLVLAAAARAGSLAGVEQGLLDDVWRDVLRDFDEARQAELRAFFQEVWQDRSLIGQLRPSSIQALAPQLAPAPGVRYASVALMAARPERGLALGRLRPSHQLYRMLHGLAAWSAPPAPPQALGYTTPLATGLGRRPEPTDSDGIVPTLAQTHGALLHVTRGDHLDVLGYFHDPHARPKHVDWLQTRSDFDRSAFEATWAAVGRWIAASARRG